MSTYLDTTLAEDLTQETFLAAFRNNIRCPADERGQAAWLRGIARNLFLAHCRRTKNSPIRIDSQLLEQAENLWKEEFLRDGDGFDYVEALRACMKRLSDRQRQLIELRYAKKTSRPDMARLLQMTEDGVKSALQRVRAALADCIQTRLRLES